MVKIIWDLPFATHKRFVESLTDVPHLQSMLHGRYIGFIENIRNSKKPQLQILFHLCKSNFSTNTGKNIGFLSKVYEKFSLNSLIESKHMIKKNRVNPLEEGEDWKINIIEELSLAKFGFLEIDLNENDIEVMLELIATE